VVTLRLDHGALFTHRVIRIAEQDGVRYVETKGDANDQPDPALTPVSHVAGRVEFALPLVGYLMAMLGTLPGAATLLLAAATLFVAIWLLEDKEASEVAVAGARPRVGDPSIGVAQLGDTGRRDVPAAE